MTLTDQQIADIKKKIEDEVIRPHQAIRLLFPGEDTIDLRKQFFAVHKRKEFEHLFTEEPVVETKEEKIAKIEESIIKLEARKNRIDIEMTELKAIKDKLEG